MAPPQPYYTPSSHVLQFFPSNKSPQLYFSWPLLQLAKNTRGKHFTSLCSIFITYDIHVELSSYGWFNFGGLIFFEKNIEGFLKSWGVRHHISSDAFPHRVKTVKQMIIDNTEPNVKLDTDPFQLTIILTYRNTPNLETRISSSICIFDDQPEVQSQSF